MKQFVPFEGGNAELLRQLSPEDRLIPYQVSWATKKKIQPTASELASPDAVPAGRQVQVATVQQDRR